MSRKDTDGSVDTDGIWSVGLCLDFLWNMMKFQQRLLLITTLALVVTTCMIFLADLNFDGWIDSRANIVVDVRNLYIREWSESPSFNTDVCFSTDELKPNANISTLWLVDKNNYELVNGGQYILPTQHENQLSTPPTPLTVLLMPHSHNDPGWLRTMEEYYVYSTKKILNNMVEKLRLYRNMTFVWAETVFLTMWWNELEDDVKAQVRRLVRNGQLEIVSGGWVMPDEATTSYYSVIEQLMEGHNWLLENLHVKPKNSWSVDVFGHSGSMPYFWKHAGFDNMVVQRIHQATKATLAKVGGLEFKWRQYWDVKGDWDILCHVMPYMLYNVKHTCGPNPHICIQFDFRPQKSRRILAEPISLKNIEMQSKFLYDQFRKKASLYKYDVILVPIGDDFRYDSKEEWDMQYHNYNMLANHMNSQPNWNVKVKFGTVQDYFDILREREKKAIRFDNKMTFPSLSGDFFPYSDKDDSYWTGYYSTRPFDKRFSREVESYLRAADILSVMAYAVAKRDKIDMEVYHDTTHYLQLSRRNLALFMHHDSITGTSKEYVVQDLENKLYTAFNASQRAFNLLTQFVISRGRLSHPPVFQQRDIRRSATSVTTQQVLTTSQEYIQIVIFNSLGRYRCEMVSFLVDSSDIVIKNAKHEIVPYQLNPVWESATVLSRNKFEVVFQAKMEPLSLTSFYLYKTDNAHNVKHPAKITVFNALNFAVPTELKFNFEVPKHSGSYKEDIVLESEVLAARFNSKTGMLQSLTDKMSGNVTSVQIQFMKYKARGSGAYLFFPEGEATPLLKGVPIIRVLEGPFLSRIEILYENIQQFVTLYNIRSEQGRGLHIKNRLDMHANNVKNLKDSEIIMRLDCDIQNRDHEFYTDQNGYQLIKRRTKPKMYIESNYYPVTSMIQVEDFSKRVTLHTAQSHGGASLARGQVEVMLDRELLRDDERGLSEGVVDNKLTDTFFILQVEYRTTNSERQSRDLTFPSLLSYQISDFLQRPVIPLFTTIASDIFLNQFVPVRTPLPCDINIVSLKNLVNSDLKYMNTSLLLHRRGYSCDFPLLGLNCDLKRNVSLASFLDFPLTIFRDLRKTTLTHLYALEKLTLNANLSIPNNEIGSFIFNVH